MSFVRHHLFIIVYLAMYAVALVSVLIVRQNDLARICSSQKQTVISVTNAFQEFRKTVLLSYEQFPPDAERRARDAAFFNAILKVLEPPRC